jgi:hypothetical protein
MLFAFAANNIFFNVARELAPNNPKNLDELVTYQAASTPALSLDSKILLDRPRVMESTIEQARLGKRVAIVMDEAQNRDHAVLELIRMLSNFETPKQNLLQIILAGQSHLAEKIAFRRPRAAAPADLDLRPSKTILSGRDATLHRPQVASRGLYLQDPVVHPGRLTLIAGSSGGLSAHHQQLVFQCLVVGMRI